MNERVNVTVDLTLIYVCKVGSMILLTVKVNHDQ